MSSFEQFVNGVIQQLEQGTARVQAAAASLCYVIDRWQPSSATSQMRYGLAMEPVLLPKHKRRGQWYLENGEIIDYGKTAHTVRAQEPKTSYFRRSYTLADVSYLERCVTAQRSITADEADRILRTMKPDRSYGKRRPASAGADPYLPQWRERPEQHLSPREMVMQSGLKGRSLARELARIK
jgi:hypothetical protein